MMLSATAGSRPINSIFSSRGASKRASAVPKEPLPRIAAEENEQSGIVERKDQRVGKGIGLQETAFFFGSKRLSVPSISRLIFVRCFQIASTAMITEKMKSGLFHVPASQIVGSDLSLFT